MFHSIKNKFPRSINFLTDPADRRTKTKPDRVCFFFLIFNESLQGKHNTFGCCFQVFTSIYLIVCKTTMENIFHAAALLF